MSILTKRAAREEGDRVPAAVEGLDISPIRRIFYI
jgi:hypothetical protein